jgi:queuine tRNA-ribosyltransferase
MAFTDTGRVVIKNAAHARDPEPLSPDCRCHACRHYSRAYLRHLFMAREILAYRLLTVHSLYYYFHLMARMRQALADGRFAEFRRDFYAKRTEGGRLSG